MTQCQTVIGQHLFISFTSLLFVGLTLLYFLSQIPDQLASIIQRLSTKPIPKPINTLTLQTHVGQLTYTEILTTTHEFPWSRQMISGGHSLSFQSVRDLIFFSWVTLQLSHPIIMYCAYLVPSIYCSLHIHVLYSLCVCGCKKKYKLLTMQTSLLVISHCNTCKKGKSINCIWLWFQCFMFRSFILASMLEKHKKDYQLMNIHIIHRNRTIKACDGKTSAFC